MSSLTNQKRYRTIEVDMGCKGAPQYLAKRIQAALRDDVDSFRLGLKAESRGCFPNICVPVSGIIDYYRKAHNCEFTALESWESSEYLSRSGTLFPLKYDPASMPPSFLDRVWKFDQDTHFEIVSGILDSLRRAERFGEGVLHGVELALNEVTDNTLLHAGSEDDSLSFGFVMAQYHYREHKIAVAVFDAGQGIPASLRAGGVVFHTAHEALQKSLMQGVTDGNGAGNGLWMMDQIVLASKGSFDLTSDGVRYSVRHMDTGNPKATSSKVNKIKEGTTLVDFQLKSDTDISLEDVLGTSPTYLWYEDHIDESTDYLIVDVKRESRGVGSRYEAGAFANTVLNLISGADCRCVLDFSGIPIVSASFADQLVGDLIKAVGFVGFVSRIRFKHLSKSSVAVIDECFRNRFFGPKNRAA